MGSFEGLTAERFIEALDEAEIDALVVLFAHGAVLDDAMAEAAAGATD